MGGWVASTGQGERRDHEQEGGMEKRKRVTVKEEERLSRRVESIPP